MVQTPTFSSLVTLAFIITIVITPNAASFVIMPSDEVRVGFLGNSILYFNDCPRLLEQMLLTKYNHVLQDSCFRGGASLPSLWKDGNGMQTKFGSSKNAIRDDGHSVDIGADTVSSLLQRGIPTAASNDNGISNCDIAFREQRKHWDFVIMNDQTQAPARPESRAETIEALHESYGPLLSSTCPVLLQTTAYRRQEVNNSSDLGTVTEFTKRVREGYDEYAAVLLNYSNDVRVAPVGDAFLWVHDAHFQLWNTLFHTDDFHPSPHGTWLQACVLYCTIVGEAPPVFQSEWFARARFLQGSDVESLPLPSALDAEELRKAACIVCSVALTSS